MSVYIQYRIGTTMPFGDLVEKSELTEQDKNMISDGWARVWFKATRIEDNWISMEETWGMPCGVHNAQVLG